MTVPSKPVEAPDRRTVEQRFSAVGARIDHLIEKATEIKTRVAHDAQDARELSEDVMDELKTAMDKAWHDVNQAWDEIKAGTGRAAEKLHSRKGCCEHKDESA